MGERVTIQDYYKAVRTLHATHAKSSQPWRYGQTLFNALDMMRPELAAQVRGIVGLDPFYVVGGTGHPTLLKFESFVEAHWKETI